MAKKDRFTYLGPSTIDPLTGISTTEKEKEKNSRFTVLQPSGGPDIGTFGSTGVGESKFDKNILPSEIDNLNQIRASNQTTGGQAFNSVVGGIASGVLTALEDMSYIIDLENNIGRILNLENVDSNWFADIMKQGKEGLETLMPIYKKQPEKVFDFSDPGFYFSSIKGILDSAIGFAIPGMAASKGISSVQRAMRLNKYLKMITGNAKTQQLVNSLGSGFITNFGEGKMMALEQFENATQLFEQQLFQENYNNLSTQYAGQEVSPQDIHKQAVDLTMEQLDNGKREEFESIAGEEANKFITRNRVFMLTDAMGLHGIQKGKGFSRDLLKRQGLGTNLKDFTKFNLDNPLIQGVKEAGEEIGQNVLQMEGEYQTLKRAGGDVSDTPQELSERVYDFALSDKALLEGMMGFFGGGPQRVFTHAISGNYSKSSRQQYKARYDSQQEQLAANKEFLNSKLGQFAEAQLLRSQAVQSGKDNLEEIVKKSGFQVLAGDNLQRGTTEQLERSLKDIIEGVSEEERIANGWDEDYQQQAKDQLEELKVMEKKYNSYVQYENQRDVWDNRMNRKIMDEERQSLEENITETEVQLETETRKNPDLEKALKEYKKNLVTVDKNISDLDKEYKHLTSVQTQKDIIKKRKNQAKQIGEIERQLKDKAKKDKATEKAAERKKRNEKKEQEEKKKEKEPDIKEEDQDIQDNDIQPEEDTQDIKGDPFFEGDDNIETSEEETDNVAKKSEAKQNFNKSADDLLNELESSSPKEQSKAQRLVGIIEDMIEQYKDSVEKDEVEFSEIVEALVEQYGIKRLAPLFGQIEAVYKLTKEGRDYIPTNDIEEYRKLTNDEKKELESLRREERQNTKGVYTSLTEEEHEKNIDQLEKEVQKNNKKDRPDDDSLEIDYLRVKVGHNIIAYLSKLYDQVFGRRREVNDTLNKDIINVNVLDPAKFGPGTKVTLKIEDVDSVKVYQENDNTKKKITWKEKKDLWRTAVSKGDMTEAEMERRRVEQIPIAIYAGEEKIGYLHETEWVNENNVSGDVKKDKANSYAIRKHVVDNDGYETTIISKSSGYMSKSVDGEQTLAKAMPDKSLQLVVGSKGEYKSNRNKVFTPKKLLNKKKPQEGVTHVIIPIGKDEEIALPLRHKKLGDNQDSVNTIMTALEIFLYEKADKNSPNYDEESERIAKLILKETEINIKNENGIADFIKMFLNNYDIGKSNSLYEYITKDSGQTMRLSNDVFVKLNSRPETNDMNFQIARGSTGAGFKFPFGRHPYVSKASLAKLSKSEQSLLLEAIRRELGSVYTHTNLDHLGKEQNIVLIRESGAIETKSYEEFVRESTTTPFLSFNIGTEENPNYIYTIQPVIEMDFSEITGEQRSIDQKVNQKESETTEEESTETQPKEETNPRRKEYRRGKKPNLDNLEDSSVAVLTEEQLDKTKELSEARIEDEKVKGVVVGKMGASRQQQLVDFLRSEIVNALFTNKKVKAEQIYGELKTEFKDDLETAKENLVIGTEEKDEALIAESEAMIKEMNLILDNWEVIKGITEQQIERINNVTKVKVSDDSETEEEEEQRNENESWSSNEFTNDPSDGLARQIKEFLSGIGAYRIDEDGNRVPELNYLGLQKPMSYQELYEVLQRLTPNLRPNFEEMMVGLEEIAEDPEKTRTYPFMPELVKKLRQADEQVKNQFVSGMTNHDVDMRFIMFSRNKDGGTKLREFQSNANAIAQVIEANWYSNLIAGTAVAVLEQNGEYIIDEQTRDRLVQIYDDMIKSGVYEEAKLRQWLQELGIILSDETFRDLINGQIYHTGKKWTLEQHMKNGLFKVLSHNIRTRGNTSLISGDRLIKDGVIRSLARHEAEYAVYAHSNSHRTGNKTVYSYSQNKYLINRVRELKDFRTGSNPLLDELAKLSFNGVSQWVTLLRKNNGDNAFHKNFERWLFSLEPIKKEGSKSKDNKELHKLSETDIEIAKIGMLQAAYSDKSGELNRIIKVLYPTTSDKTTVMGLRIVAENISLDEEGNIEDESIDTLVDRLVRPEIARIRSIQKGQKDSNLEGYEEGGQQFLFLPELNNIPEMFDGDGNLNVNVDSDLMPLIKAKVREYVENLVERKLKDWTENGIIGGKETYLNSEFLNIKIADTDGSITKKNPLHAVNVKSRIRGAATDMVFQYLIADAEIAMTFTGDPALYYKQAKENKGVSKFTEGATNSEYNFVADAEETYINIGKRLAADIAPGYEIADAINDNYTQLFIQDAKGQSENRHYLTKLLDGQEAFDRVIANTEKVKNGEMTEKEFTASIRDLNSRPYYSFSSSDAQEYTTWKEHLHVMFKAGELSRREYDEAYSILEAGKELTSEQLSKVMQPMKPVYADNIIADGTDVERRMYIKSSSFPLLPQLTKGTDLDNLRVAIEDIDTNGRVRVAYSTAVKVGNVSNPANIFGEDGRIIPSDQMTFEGASMTLNRKGFRIQQRVPAKKSTEINKVTQASKNLFINMLEVEGFTLPRAWFNSDEEFKNQKSFTGEELQEIYHTKYEDLHKLQLEILLEEIAIDGDPTKLNKEKLRDLLLTEARTRNYPISDQELINIDEELKFLPYSPSANKYEALLNSIVTNRVIRLKLPGKSYVLGSEEGFRTKLTHKEAEQEIEGKGIIYTSSWTGKLLPAREGKGGEMLPAQAIVPWKFKDKRGNIIKMDKYIIEKNGVYYIDKNKVSPEVMTLFGMRIPNQGPNSQSMIEIVGFLPEQSGDLFIATKDYVVQMGSDFDVDKLYTYMYNLYESDEYGVRVHRSTKTRQDKIKALQNEIIDIHISIHKNPAPEVQGQIATPLGFWKLKDDSKTGGLAQEVSDLRRQRQTQENAENKIMFTGLSDQYQREKFKNASSGKAGVGVFSLDSMFNAVAQGKGLVYMVPSFEGEAEPLNIRFGNEESFGDLSDVFALDGVTYKSDVIAGYQSAAVDNEKEQILDKLNINSHTFKAIKLLNQLGFTEVVPLFIAQDIIIDYVKELDRLSSITSGYQPNREQLAAENVLKMDKYALIEGESYQSNLASDKATPQALRDYIAFGNKAPNYAAAQRALLDKFIEISELGQSIQNLQSAINPDSKGLGKSVMESQIKEDQIFKLIGNKISNAESLIGDIQIIGEIEVDNYKADGYVIRKKGNTTYAIKPKTINGHAIVYGLFTNNDLWSQLFPYQTAGVEGLMEKIEDIAAGDNEMATEAKAEKRLEIWKDLKSFIYSDDKLELHDTTVSEERIRLLYDKYKETERVTPEGVYKEKTHTHMSLASIIRAIHDTKLGKENPFLSRLETSIEKNGDPSLVKYRASAAEHADETHIYIGILKLLETNSVIGTFNGKEYTAKELMQELVLYSYITGGIQEAIQFVKYIPVAYLKSIPFADKIANTTYFAGDFNIVKTGKAVTDLYSIPPFVEQFIQHHPDRVAQITETEIEKKNHKNFETATEFTLNKKGISRTGVQLPFEDSKRPTPFVTIRAGNSNSKLKLFKYYKGKYVQIDTLGILGASEYNRNTHRQVSLIGRNKATVPVKSTPKGITPSTAITDDNAELEEKGHSIADKVLSDNTKLGVLISGEDALGSVLMDIINADGDPHMSVLANELMKNIEQFPPNISFELQQEEDGQAGKFNYGKKIVTVFKEQFTEEHGTNSSFSVNRLIMHELLHAITGYKIALFEQEEEVTEEAIRKVVPNFTLTDKDKKAIKSIQVLKNQAEQAILKDKKTRDLYNTFQRQLEAKKGVDPELRGMFYGLTSLREFVSEALTNPMFQNMLNNIEAPSGKTFWEALKERLLNLLEGIFPNVKEGSVLEQSVYNVFDLVVDMQKKDNTEKDNIGFEINDDRDIQDDTQKGIDFSDMSVLGKPTMTQIKKELGIGKNLFSDKRKNLVLKKLDKYNDRNDSSHSIDFVATTPTSWKIKSFNRNYESRNEEKKAEKDSRRNENNLTGVKNIEQTAEEIRAENLVTEKESDLGYFNEEGDFLPPSYFPASSKRKLGPKFQDYANVKEAELKNLWAKMGKFQVKKKQEQDRAKRQLITKRMYSLEKEIESVNNDIDRINDLNRLDQIEVYAEEDMKTLESIMRKKNPTGSDIETAKRIIHIWQKAADFSGNEPHIFYDPEEFDEARGGLKEMTAKFKEWGSRADEYNNRLLEIQETYMYSELENLFGEGPGDLSNAMPDVNFLTKNLLDVTEVDSVIFQGVGRMVADANFASKLELDEIFEELDDLIKATGLKNFSIFQQTFSNDDNRTTGELVYRFTQSYFDWSSQLHGRRKGIVYNNRNKKNGNIAIARANKEFVEELRKKVEVFDARILFYDEELYKGDAPTEAQIEAEKDKLRELLGEKAFNEYYELNKKKIAEYKEDLETYTDNINAEMGENPQLAQHTINGFIAKNSPYLFAEVMENGYDAVTYFGQHVYPTNSYLTYVPKKVDNKGESTGFYDNKFSQIENNESYLNLYNFMFNLLQDMKMYLPNEKIGFMQINSIPTLKKKALQQMTEGGVKGGFSKSKDLILEALRMDDLSDIGTNLEGKELQLQLISNNKTRINNFVELKDTEHRAKYKKSPTAEDVAEWRKQIINEIAKEKSFDLGRVMKAFAAMAVTYKHKSSIEDSMRIAHDIISRTLERRENAAGDQMKDKYGNILATKGLRNLKDMLDNFLEVAYWGYPSNRPEGKGKKKVLTGKEKELKELLEKSQEELKQLLASKQITEKDFIDRNEVIVEQLEVLGGVKVKSKFGDILLKYIQLKGMGWNVFAAFANMGFGIISNVIEASDGRNYSMKSYRKAQALVLNSVGKNASFNWLATGNAKKIRVLMNRFDVLKEAKNELYKTTEQKLFTKIGKRVEWLNPFNPQSRSEYFNQAPVMIAMMMEQKIKTDSGEEISIWDMYDKDGNIKEGYTFDRKKMFSLKANIDQVVKMNHGNYDPNKPLAAKRRWIGRAVTQFRTWALQGFQERFHKEFKDRNLYNAKEDENFINRKGRYRSYAAFFQESDGIPAISPAFAISLQLLRKLVGFNTNFDKMANDPNNEFTEVDAANMRKNLTEIVMYMILTGLTLLLKVSLDDDDDNKKKLAANFLINQMARLATDIAFYTNPIEFERLARNAIPAFSFVTDGVKFVNSAWGMILGEEDILQSGPNKGMSRTWRDFQKLIPGPTQIQKIKSASSQVYKKN